MPGRTLDVQPGSFFASSETMAAGNASNFHPVLPSRYVAQCHSREKEMTSVVDAFFLRNWPFPDERSRKKFLAAGFSRVTCYYFPMARHDRIEHACMLLTILFLVDDYLEHLSLQEGHAYNAALIAIVRGERAPDNTIAAQRIMSEIWAAMRACDAPRADAIVEPLREFMAAQTDDSRLSVRGLGNYLRYREGDVGKALLASLMAFCMGLTVTPTIRKLTTPIERNCARHLSIVNDIYSYRKEVAAAKELHVEGGALCNAVAIMMEEANLTEAGAIDALWACVRGWEVRHEELLVDLEMALAVSVAESTPGVNGVICEQHTNHEHTNGFQINHLFVNEGHTNGEHMNGPHVVSRGHAQDGYNPAGYINGHFANGQHSNGHLIDRDFDTGLPTNGRYTNGNYSNDARVKKQNLLNIWEYVKGFEYQMSGNEAWSRATKRYHE